MKPIESVKTDVDVEVRSRSKRMLDRQIWENNRFKKTRRNNEEGGGKWQGGDIKD